MSPSRCSASILTAPAATLNGRFLIDEEILRARGVEDFSGYAVDPAQTPLIDLFPRVDLESAPIAQIRAKAAETYSILPPPVITPERLVVPSIHCGPDIPVFLFHPADARAGGGAILLKKNYNRNLLLGSHIMSDGSLARTAGVEIGGTAKPIKAYAGGIALG